MFFSGIYLLMIGMRYTTVLGFGFSQTTPLDDTSDNTYQTGGLIQTPVTTINHLESTVRHSSTPSVTTDRQRDDSSTTNHYGNTFPRISTSSESFTDQSNPLHEISTETTRFQEATDGEGTTVETETPKSTSLQVNGLQDAVSTSSTGAITETDSVPVTSSERYTHDQTTPRENTLGSTQAEDTTIIFENADGEAGITKPSPKFVDLHEISTQIASTEGTALEETTLNTVDAVDDVTPCSKSNITNVNDQNCVRSASVNWLSYMDKVSTAITTVIGLLGNSITLAAMHGEPFSSIPSGYIISGLAVVDSSTLITILFKKDFVITWVGYDLRAASRAGCKIFNWVVHSSKILSAWFVVLICLERFVVICFPFHARHICTKTNALKGVAVVVALAVGYSAVWTLSSDLKNSECVTTFSTPKTKQRAIILIVIGSALIGILPMAILIILTPITCLVLYIHHRRRKQLTSFLSVTSPRNCVTKLSSMLITLCVTYIIFQLPLIISHNLAKARGESVNTTNYQPLAILYKVGGVLEAVNYSCNFFLYIACNSAFRRKVSNVIRFRKSSRPTVVSRSSDASVSLAAMQGSNSGVEQQSRRLSVEGV